MARSAKSLVNLATAFVLGLTTNTALAENPPPVQSDQNMNAQADLKIFTGDVRAAVFELGGSLRVTELDSGNKAGQRQLAENITAIQKIINDYNATFGQPAFETPILVDGVFGPATARALIDVASREKIEEVFINVPSLDQKDEINTRFLRNTLQRLAPQSYLDAMRLILEDKREETANQMLRLCLNNTKAVSYKMEYLVSEASKVKDNYSYISPAYPAECLPELKELRIASRADAQINYLFSLTARSIPKTDVCERKEIEMSVIPRCTEFSI